MQSRPDLPRRAIGIVAVAAWMATASSAQPPVAPWTLTYSRSGRVAGQSRTVTVSDAGRIRIEDRRIGRLEVPMDRDLFVRVRDAAIGGREIAAPSRGATSPDEIVWSVTVTADGRTRHLEPTPEVLHALGRGADIGVWQALVGTWRQAALNSCTPESQPPSTDAPAIETLTFNGDSSFWVQWPGDARPASRPSVALPGLRGTFRASLSGGSLELAVEDGTTAPRDFTGTGSFRFEGERRLVLRGVWFGTRGAGARPDVCEMVFERE